jgi:glutamate/tyrosine decarboxylase-like PLP-dependent enzyme
MASPLGLGRPADEVLAAMESLRTGDVKWRDGRAFSLAYSAGPEVLALSEEAYRRFSGENALNTAAFPSLRSMHDDVVSCVSGWLHGPASARGFMTSGGTESLVLVVRAAVERARREGRLPAHPNMVLPTSAHAALEKGADYFGVESRRVDVRNDWRADVEAMAAAADDSTVLFVASAPQYPQGVIDPVAEVAALAVGRDVNMHVDACMGGVVLPALERAGVPLPPWDFRVPGVTSVSVDLHKYGYTAKGAGVLVHRDKLLRNDQVFVTDNWLGGVYGSSGILGTKSGGPIASAWAVMSHLGDAGYERLATAARSVTLAIAAHVEGCDDLRLRSRPDSTLLAFGDADDGPGIFALADELRERGWWVDRQGPPDSIHLTVNAVHEPLVDEFLADLDAARRAMRGRSGSSGAYGSVD